MISNWQNFLSIIPIAAAVSAIVFLVKFFGKVISDQTPFADDRKWLEEIGGVKFFAGYVLSPIIWVSLWYSRGWKFWLFPKEDLWIFIISIVSLVIASAVRIKAIDFFTNNEFDEGDIGVFFKKIFDFKNDIKLSKGDWLIMMKFLFLSANSFFIIVLLFYFYKWHAYYHLFAAIIYLFNHLIVFALLISLNRGNILRANIEFIDSKKKSIKNCRILKANDDNIRVKSGKRVFLLNKSIISRLEFVKDSKKGVKK